VLVAKKGQGAAFPQYLEEALQRYEREQAARPAEPGLEGSCGNKCGSQSVF